MEIGNAEMIKGVGEKMLERLAKLAKHKKDSPDPERGRTLFGPKPDQKWASKVFKLILECLQEWGLKWENSIFQQTYLKLRKEGVTFQPRGSIPMSPPMKSGGGEPRVTPGQGQPIQELFRSIGKCLQLLCKRVLVTKRQLFIETHLMVFHGVVEGGTDTPESK
jgi:hypothetical protein